MEIPLRWHKRSRVASRLKQGVSDHQLHELQNLLQYSEAVERTGFIIGSPTLGSYSPPRFKPHWELYFIIAAKNKAGGCLYSSYGWSGEAIDPIEGKLRNGIPIWV